MFTNHLEIVLLTITLCVLFCISSGCNDKEFATAKALATNSTTAPYLEAFYRNQSCSINVGYNK